MGDLGQLLPDGTLVHLGRRDFQVKVRGFRVELEEIEMTLREHPGIRAAAAVARPDARGETALTAYVVVKAPPGPDGAALRRYLGERLPSHMVPRAIVTLDALPTTVTGKVDRQALPDPDPRAGRPAPVPPRSPVEERVATIWGQVLGVEGVGVDDDFLELGGSSLLATRVVSRVLADLRIDVSVGALLAAPTVAEMAVVITTELAGRLPTGLLADVVDSTGPGGEARHRSARALSPAAPRDRRGACDILPPSPGHSPAPTRRLP